MDPTRVNEFGVSAEMLEKNGALDGGVEDQPALEEPLALEETVGSNEPLDSKEGEKVAKNQKPKSKKAKKID